MKVFAKTIAKFQGLENILLNYLSKGGDSLQSYQQCVKVVFLCIFNHELFLSILFVSVISKNNMMFELSLLH